MTLQVSPNFPKGVVNLYGSGAAVSSASGTLTVTPGTAVPALSIVMQRFDDGEGLTSVWVYVRGEETKWHGFFDIDSED